MQFFFDLFKKAKLGLSAVVFVAFTAMPVLAQPPVLTAEEAASGMANGDLVVLDIRRPQEWAETGIADGAWPVSMHTPDFPRQLRAILDQYAPEQIALICATGGRTAYVTEVLEKNGITGVADVSEGMFGNGAAIGWIARGLPVVAPQDAMTDYDAAQQSWN